jgi:hypothetical protein
MGSVSVEMDALQHQARPWHHHYRWCSMETKRAASIYPTVDEINALPEKFRQYIHDLETRCDKSGDVQMIAILRENRDALRRRVEELQGSQPFGERVCGKTLPVCCAA